MASFPPGTPPGTPGDMSPFSQDEAQRQVAMERLGQSAFQQSCLMKTIMAGGGGFVIGGAFGMFMSGMRYDAPGAFALPGAPQFNNLKWHRQLYEGVKDMGTQGLRTGKNFGKIGAMFSGTECILESYRAKNDFVNPVMAGCIVGGYLSRNNGPLAVAGGCAGFAAFSYAIELYMHRETEEED